MSRRAHGEGTLRQRKGGLWECRAIVGTSLDGSPIRQSFYAKSKTKAAEKYKQYLKGQLTPIEQVKTVGEWASYWLDVYKKDKVAYKSYYNYELYVTKHIIPELGNLKLSQVRPAHIERFFGQKHELSYSAQHHILIALRGIFKTAQKNGFCTSNPADEVTIAVKTQDTPTVFAPEDIKAVLEAGERHRYGFYVQALLYSGLRTGELLALQWNDVDLKNELIHIRQALAKSEVTIQSASDPQKR